MPKTAIVIGGGAAGFFCAVNAARLDPGLKVIIAEKTNKLLSKVKVSGGGRCNVTHSCFDIAEMTRKYPRGAQFLKKSFHEFFTIDTIQWFKERRVSLKTEEDGRMFPVTDNSQTIIDCLMQEADKYGVEILMKAEVSSLDYEAGRFLIGVSDHTLQTPEVRRLTADFICIACGGYPKSSMFGWLKQLGHSIEEPVPSLFTFNMPGNPVTALMGISVPDAQVKIIGSKLNERGPVLITHWGMSGPVILRLSAWGARELHDMKYEFSIAVNWLPGLNEQQLRSSFQQLRADSGSQKISNRNPFGLPQRLWEHLLQQSGIHEDRRWADLPAVEQHKLIRNLNAQGFAVKGKTTFKEEFVTAGGIRLPEIDHHTMQSKVVPGLFFAGEVMDVDGITGGFNFQHAWTSGFIAARSITDQSRQ